MNKKIIFMGTVLTLTLMTNIISTSVALTNTVDPNGNILKDIKGITSNEINNSLIRFSDMSSHWSRDSVGKLTTLGIIEGYPDGNFKPNQNILVDEFIKLVITAMGHIPQTTKGYWAEPFIQIAKDQNLIGDSEFSDYSRPITRQEMAKIIVNATLNNEDAPDEKLLAFLQTVIKDYSYISSEHKDTITVAYGMGLISGYPDGTFKGTNNSTRAEASVVVVRLLDPRLRNKNVVDEKDRITLLNKATGKDITLYPPVHIENGVIRIANALKDAAILSKGYANIVYDGEIETIVVNLYEKAEDANSNDPNLIHAKITISMKDKSWTQSFPYAIYIYNIEETKKLHDEVINGALRSLFEKDADKLIREYERLLDFAHTRGSALGQNIMNDRVIDFRKDGGSEHPFYMSISRKGYRLMLP